MNAANFRGLVREGTTCVCVCACPNACPCARVPVRAYMCERVCVSGDMAGLQAGWVLGLQAAWGRGSKPRVQPGPCSRV